MSDPLSGFESLFRGSARLGVLLGALDLPWERVTPFVAAFPGEMGGYQELSVSDRRKDLGLMTRGSGKEFTFRVTRFMETHGIDEERLRRLLVTARFFEHRNLFFKVEIGPDGIEEFSWYFRRRPDIEVAVAWLSNQGVGDDGLKSVAEVAGALRKRTVHFVARGDRPDGSSVCKLYFSQPDTMESFERLRLAAERLGVEASDWAPMDSRAELLAGRTSFLSLGFADGALLPGAKVDIAGLSPVTVAAMMADAGCDPDAEERLKLLLTTMDRPNVDYTGFRLSPGQPLQTRAYAFRAEGGLTR